MALSSKLSLLVVLSLLAIAVTSSPVTDLEPSALSKSSTSGSDVSLNVNAHFLKKLRKKIKKTISKVKKEIGKIGKKAKHVAACNPVTKSAFATAFSAAVTVPARNCPRITEAEWKKVGCSNPASHRRTRICAPAVWGGVLGKVIKASAMSLKSKVLFKRGISRWWLFNTREGRKLVRHELAHIRQQAGVSAWRWGYRYYAAYCSAGRSYSKNRYEVDARRYENDIC